MASLSDLRERARAALRGKFQRDALWNFGSVGVLAVCGFGLNVLIGRFWGSSALGVFSQVMAAYIFFGQAAVGGVNLSALRAISEDRADRARVAVVIVGAIVPTVLLALACTLLFWLSSGWIAAWLDSPGVADGIEAAAPGLFFFALNKLGMSVVNAARRMRAFAIYTSLRYVLMIVGLFLAGALGVAESRLAILFSFAEGVLFVPLAVEVWLQITAPVGRAWREWSREHFRYGVKSVASGMLLELNSKIDVLMIGAFMPDSPVGVYTVAALAAEGLFQLLVVLQNNYNPTLAEHISSGRVRELEALVATGRKWTYRLFVPIGALALAGFPIFFWLLGHPEFRDGWAPFAFLMLGMALASGYMPFAQTLLMANRPGWHTGMMASIALCNIVFNSILIPPFGLAGAAAATAIALVYSAFALRWTVKRQVGLRL